MIGFTYSDDEETRFSSRYDIDLDAYFCRCPALKDTFCDLIRDGTTIDNARAICLSQAVHKEYRNMLLNEFMTVPNTDTLTKLLNHDTTKIIYYY